MARIDKRIERMRNAPNGVSPDELDSVLRKLGFARKPGKGDHRRCDHDSLAELMRKPYHIVLVRDEAADGQVGWVATVAELPGCLSQGDTPQEAAEHIQDAMETWFEAALERGSIIPKPAKHAFPVIPSRAKERDGKARSSPDRRVAALRR